MKYSGTDNTEKRIETAAMQLFFTRGVDAVSIRDIAKAAECNSSMIHYYFRTKEKLLYFIVERTTVDTVTIVDEEIKQKKSSEQFNAFIDKFFNWALLNRYGFDVLFINGISEYKESLSDLIRERREVVFSQYKKMIKPLFAINDQELLFSFYTFLGTIKMYLLLAPEGEKNHLEQINGFRKYLHKVMDNILAMQQHKY